jgi:NTP pyrophosphatase (non-canonical NTP hydrolase)
MDLTTFQQNALSTWNENPTIEGQLLNAALGLSGETGEITDIIKKHLFPAKSGDGALRVRALAYEIGDLMFYAAVMAHLIGYTLNEIAIMNNLKLQERFGGQRPTLPTNLPEARDVVD